MVIGSGVMGRGIANSFACAGIEVAVLRREATPVAGLEPAVRVIAEYMGPFQQQVALLGDPGDRNARDTLRARLSEAVHEANKVIYQGSLEIPRQVRMGTTFCGGLLSDRQALIINVGDSRAYLYRDGKLQLLSHDQTLAQALADNGVIDPAEVENHRFNHVLVSALGCTSNMEPYCGRHELEPNDKLMICSDGLTKHLNDRELAQILSRDDPAEMACNRLVESAKEAGGSDNITVVLAKFLSQLVDPDSIEATAVDVEAESEIS